MSIKKFDKHTPIIVPFAPVHFGKTCLLHRLISYLQDKGYSVNLNVCSMTQHICAEYMRSTYSHCSPYATAIPIHGKILWQGHMMAQFIDFPGDFLYDIYNPHKPSALKEVLASSNKKIWLFLLDLDGGNGLFERENYSERIREIVAHISSNDKIIVVVNKIDICSTSLRSKKDLIQTIYRQYPTVLNCFKNQNPVTKLWRPFNCDIIPFTAGLFCRTYDNKEMFQPGLDTYPKQLWKAISKSLC